MVTGGSPEKYGGVRKLGKWSGVITRASMPEEREKSGGVDLERERETDEEKEDEMR